MSATLGVRVLAVLAAVSFSWLLLDRNASQRACDAAGARVFAASGGFEPLAGLDPALADVRAECEGATGLLAAAETIRQASVRRPFLARRAVDVARAGTRTEPENYIAWVTLAAALARTDLAAAREPFARAKELNPLLRTPASLQATR